MVDGGNDGRTLKEGSTSDASVADEKRQVRQPTGSSLTSDDSHLRAADNDTNNGRTAIHTAYGK
jgi:hypothetical protein